MKKEVEEAAPADISQIFDVFYDFTKEVSLKLIGRTEEKHESFIKMNMYVSMAVMAPLVTAILSKKYLSVDQKMLEAIFFYGWSVGFSLLAAALMLFGATFQDIICSKFYTACLLVKCHITAPNDQLVEKQDVMKLVDNAKRFSNTSKKLRWVIWAVQTAAFIFFICASLKVYSVVSFIVSGN